MVRNFVKISPVLFIYFAVAVFSMAQRQTGSVFGKTTDTEGVPLPGVVVTLSRAGSKRQPCFFPIIFPHYDLISDLFYYINIDSPRVEARGFGLERKEAFALFRAPFIPGLERSEFYGRSMNGILSKMDFFLRFFKRL